MFTNDIKYNWKSDTPIPFNQATGTELRTLYQRDLKKLQAEQLEAKQEFTKITKDLAIIKQTLVKKRQDLALQNQPQIKKNLQKEINALSQKKKEIVNEFEKTKETLAQLKEEIADLTGALERLNTDLKIDAELETDGYFGSSRLGQCMSAVVQTAALPLTIMLEVATRHPFLVGGMIIANQMFSTAAATLTTPPTTAEQASTNKNETVTKQATATQTAATQENAEPNSGVNSINACLNDYYIRNNGTTTHRLINICANATSIEGTVDLKCSINSPPNNPINAFKLKKQGDDYTVETQHTENCQQPILIGKPPANIGNCLYDFITEDNNGYGTYTHKVVNGCDKEAAGYFEKDCGFTDTWHIFTLKNRGDAYTLQTFGYCNHKKVYEGKTSITSYPCADLISTFNTDNTITQRLVSDCQAARHHVYMKKGCAVHESTNDEWNRFTLTYRGDERTFLVHDTKACRAPFVFYTPWIKPDYAKKYCPAKDPLFANLPQMPKAAKIIAGEGLQSTNARHLVYVLNKSKWVSCSGTLISDKHVLTAAHCLIENRFSPSPPYVEQIKIKHDPFPKTNQIQPIPTHEYNVKAGFIAPCYYTNPENCDVALLEVEHPIKNGKSISLPTDEDFCEFAQAVDKVIQRNRIPSFESNAPNVPNAREAQEAREIWQNGNTIIQGFGREKNSQGQLVSSKTAQHGNVVADYIGSNDGEIRTTSTNKGTDTSNGDSGGPLIFETKQGKKVQIGTSAHGHQARGITFYTNLHNKSHREWIAKHLAENSTSTKIPSGDLSALRVNPDSCVEQSDQPDGFLSWLISSLSSEQGRRKLTFTNLCHDKNHPSKVNIRFYSSTENGKSKEKLETIHGIESATQVVAFAPGETRVFHTDGTPITARFSWHDID